MLEKIKDHEALFIFMVSGLGYGVAFLFEWGFINFYKLPMSLIDVDITTIIKSSLLVSALIAIGYLYEHYADNSNRVSDLYKKYLTKTWWKIVLVFLFLLFIFYLFYAQYPFHIFFILCIMIISNAASHWKKNILAYISFVFFIAFFVYSIGYSYADLFQRNYLTIINEEKKITEDYVIVKYYKDKAILAKADLNKKIIYTDYQFIKLEAELSKMQFELKHTGRMTVTEPYND